MFLGDDGTNSNNNSNNSVPASNNNTYNQNQIFINSPVINHTQISEFKEESSSLLPTTTEDSPPVTSQPLNPDQIQVQLDECITEASELLQSLQSDDEQEEAKNIKNSNHTSKDESETSESELVELDNLKFTQQDLINSLSNLKSYQSPQSKDKSKDESKEDKDEEDDGDEDDDSSDNESSSGEDSPETKKPLNLGFNLDNIVFPPLKEEKDIVRSFSISSDINKAGMRKSRKNLQMEDFHFAECPLTGTDLIGLFCVFDGHAGMNCAQTLTKIFPSILKKNWEKLNPEQYKLDEDMVIDTGKRGLEQLAIMSTFWREVYKEVDENLIKFEYEGSTATTLMVWKFHDKRYLQCANIGDSSAYICINGDAVPLTEDHNLKLKPERNRITEMGIKLEPTQLRLNGLSVTRAFGDHFVKDMSVGLISQPHISTLYELEPEHSRVILASDGIWDIMSGQQAFDMIKDLEDKEASRKLLKSALSNKDCVDNVTVIVVSL